MSTVKQISSMLVVFLCLADITKSVPNPCQKGPGKTTIRQPCHVLFNPDIEDRIIRIMKSSQSFTMNFIDGTDTTSVLANSTLLKLVIEATRVGSTCITAGGTVPTGVFKNLTIINPPIGRPFLFSASFAQNEALPSSQWRIENQNMNCDNNCGVGLKPYGNYLQLYFGANTDYEVYAAMKCIIKKI